MYKSISSRTLVIAVCIALTMILWGGCARGPRVFTETDTTVDVRKGEKFRIELISNPSTGYEWQLVESLDKKKLKMTDHSFESSNEGRPGAPGKDIWVLEAIGTGKTKITLKYFRPWESQRPPAQKIAFTVKVEE